MKLPFSESEWQDVLKKIYRRAALDHAYHLLCLQNPHAAIKQISGRDIPKKVKIRFVDEADEMIIMLPSEHKHLTDKQLDQLAEGISSLVFHLDIPTKTILDA